MAHRRHRRSVGWTASDPTFAATGPLIKRWIGAAARKRRRAARQEAPTTPSPDNVTRLAWADTFGRAIGPRPQREGAPATVLAMRPRPSRSGCSTIVRARRAVSAAIPTARP